MLDFLIEDNKLKPVLKAEAGIDDKDILFIKELISGQWTCISGQWACISVGIRAVQMPTVIWNRHKKFQKQMDVSLQMLDWLYFVIEIF